MGQTSMIIIFIILGFITAFNYAYNKININSNSNEHLFKEYISKANDSAINISGNIIIAKHDTYKSYDLNNSSEKDIDGLKLTLYMSGGKQGVLFIPSINYSGDYLAINMSGDGQQNLYYGGISNSLKTLLYYPDGNPFGGFYYSGNDNTGNIYSYNFDNKDYEKFCYFDSGSQDCN